MLLDTDILIDLLRGKKEARDFLYSLPADSLNYCSAVTVAEIHSGMREAERQVTTELIESLVVLPVTKDIAETAGRFMREHRRVAVSKQPMRAGRGIKPGAANNQSDTFEPELDDCLIAATAAVEGLQLATRNRRHYPMPEVRVQTASY